MERINNKRIVAIIKQKNLKSFFQNVINTCEIIDIENFNTKNIKERKTSLLIIDSVKLLKDFHEIFDEIPFIFVSTSHKINTSILYKKKFMGVIFLNCTADLSKFGICESFCRHLYYTESLPSIIKQKLSIKYDKIRIKDTSPKILIIANNTYYDAVFQLIAFFNKHMIFEATVSNLSNIEDLKYLANSNVKLVHQSSPIAFNDYDIIITSGIDTIDAMFSEKPIFVVGSRGYGGILDSKNFDYLMSANFDGRLGAYHGEPILQRVFFQDLISLLDINWNKEGNDLDKTIRKYYKNAIDNINEFIENRIHINNSLNDSKHLLRLYPILSKYIIVSYDNDNVILKTITFNTNLGILDKDVFDLLLTFNGEKRLNEIAKEYEINLNGLIEFIKDLFKKRIIDLSDKQIVTQSHQYDN